MIPTDVKHFIIRRFDLADQETAFQLLSGATIEDGSAAGPRLIRCAAIASSGFT